MIDLLADARTATSPAAERRVLERGLELLRGEPLAGWDHLWADTDTDAARLRATQAEFLERLFAPLRGERVARRTIPARHRHALGPHSVRSLASSNRRSTILTN